MWALILTHAATAGLCVKVSHLVTYDCSAIKNERFCVYPCDWFQTGGYTYEYEDLVEKKGLDDMLADTQLHIEQLEKLEKQLVPSPSPHAEDDCG